MQVVGLNNITKALNKGVLATEDERYMRMNVSKVLQ